MKQNKTPKPARLIVALSLLFALCCSIVITDNQVVMRRAEAKNSGHENGKKVSPDLQGKSAGSSLVRVILQLNGKPTGQLNALLNRNGVHVRASFSNFNALSVELPANVVDELADFSEVAYVSADRQTQSLGHVSLTTGADAVRQQTRTTTTLLGGTTTTNYTLDGTGIGIAVLDSGLDSDHKAFLGDGDRLRIVVSRDFTGEGRTDDPYGHGTHVATIAAGNGRIANAKYIGIAPNANILNLRVLNKQGAGTVSGVLAALDWLMTNRAAYNVRVVNMSLGMPAVDSDLNDPVCQAGRRLVDARVVEVAAAGNNGKDSAGHKIYGAIHSPGDEPSAITVGASNTFGTDSRADDTMTTYSSRGPTRGYSTDANGVKHYDNLIKPDLVAPGNKIIAAEAVDNLLVMQHPSLDAGVSGNDTRREMFLNGTSLATPVVAGESALLFQATPYL